MLLASKSGSGAPVSDALERFGETGNEWFPIPKAA
jgi:hypothetical protein